MIHRFNDLGMRSLDPRGGWPSPPAHDDDRELIVEAIRGGRAADGVCEVIGELGQVLAAQFPRRADDQNELPNTVKQEDR